MTAPNPALEQRCVVTGGSRGLGRAIVLALAARGARVAFTYAHRDADADETVALARARGHEVMALKGSVADSAHVKANVAALNEAWGGVDALVNNAAITQMLPISLLDEPDWDLVMNVNVKGAYLWSRAVLRGMIKQKRGHILTIGNFASERVVEAPVHYAASKSALRGFTEALAREVGRYGIVVNLLAPGLLDVGMGKGLPAGRRNDYVEQCALGRVGTAEEIAQMAAFLVSPENTWMTGAKLVADGGV